MAAVQAADTLDGRLRHPGERFIELPANTRMSDKTAANNGMLSFYRPPAAWVQ